MDKQDTALARREMQDWPCIDNACLYSSPDGCDCVQRFAQILSNVRAVEQERSIPENDLEIARLRRGIAAIQNAAIDVCDEVAWIGENTTLFAFCEQLLAEKT